MCTHHHSAGQQYEQAAEWLRDGSYVTSGRFSTAYTWTGKKYRV